MPTDAQTPHLLHVMPAFAPGGAQVRTVQIINHLGRRFCHSIVSLNGDFSAAEAIDSAIGVQLIDCRASRNPLVSARKLAGVLEKHRPHLLLTYNWGSIDAVAANLGGSIPHIHTEDGFSDDEAVRQKVRRVLFRRLLLGRAYRVIAPSHTLLDIMKRVWNLPKNKLAHIPNGIDVDRFAPAGPGPEDFTIGTVAHLRREKRVGVLLEVFAELRIPGARLLIVGDGPERAALQEQARALKIVSRVTFAGHQRNPVALYRRMSLFALTSSTEQMPLSVLEAMSSGLPIAGTDVGDVKQMVSVSNRPYIASDRQSLAGALSALAADAALRKRIGAANREHCVRLYDRRQMLARYGALYESALLKEKTPCHAA